QPQSRCLPLPAPGPARQSRPAAGCSRPAGCNPYPRRSGRCGPAPYAQPLPKNERPFYVQPLPISGAALAKRGIPGGASLPRTRAGSAPPGNVLTHVADVQVDAAAADAAQLAGAAALPHIAVDAGGADAVVGVPDAVALERRQVQMVLEPAGGSVDTRLIAVLLPLLAERHGAGSALGLGQVVGPAGVGAGAVLAVKVDGVVQAAAVEDVSAGKGLFPCFLFVDGLAENVDAGLEARGLGPGQVALEHGIQHQGAGLVAPVTDADDDEGGARLLDLLPIHLLLVAGHVDAEGHVVLPDAVGVEVVDLVVDGLQAGQALMGGGVVVV